MVDHQKVESGQDEDLAKLGRYFYDKKRAFRNKTPNLDMVIAEMDLTARILSTPFHDVQEGHKAQLMETRKLRKQMRINSIVQAILTAAIVLFSAFQVYLNI